MKREAPAVNAASLKKTAGTLVKALLRRGETLSTAESCTGGLIAKSVTDIAGSSGAFLGACVTYTNAVKIDLLGVDPELIARVSEVSAECAAAMANGVRGRLGSTYALSTTGYAGPGGGSEKDPVGTVYIALSTPHGTRCERFEAPRGATRCGVRTAAAARAMEMLFEAWEQTPENG